MCAVHLCPYEKRPPVNSDMSPEQAALQVLTILKRKFLADADQAQKFIGETQTINSMVPSMYCVPLQRTAACTQ